MLMTSIPVRMISRPKLSGLGEHVGVQLPSGWVAHRIRKGTTSSPSTSSRKGGRFEFCVMQACSNTPPSLSAWKPPAISPPRTAWAISTANTTQAG